MNVLRVLFGWFLILLLGCGGAWAQTPSLTQIDTDSTSIAVREVNHPLAPASITQSLDPNTVVDGTSVACVGTVTTENSWYRLFDLDADHGLTGTFDVFSIDWATQNVQGSLNVTLNVYCLDDGLPFLLQFLTPAGTTGPIPVADENLVFHNDLISGACDANTQSLAAEIFAEDCNIAGCIVFFVGMNDLGQTAPTYIGSASCGITDPVDLAGLGFPNAHLVMVVHSASSEPDDGGLDDGGDVPATNAAGFAALLLAVLGSGAYLRRRGR